MISVIKALRGGGEVGEGREGVDGRGKIGGRGTRNCLRNLRVIKEGINLKQGNRLRKSRKMKVGQGDGHARINE